VASKNATRKVHLLAEQSVIAEIPGIHQRFYESCEHVGEAEGATTTSVPEMANNGIAASHDTLPEFGSVAVVSSMGDNDLSKGVLNP
jgi:hypothetical protein